MNQQVGNFANESGLDARDAILYEVCDRIEGYMQDCEVEEIDDVMGYVGVLAGIRETCGGNLPSAETINRWRNVVFDVFDHTFNDPKDAALMKPRRDVIEATFNSLERPTA